VGLSEHSFENIGFLPTIFGKVQFLVLESCFIGGEDGRLAKIWPIYLKSSANSIFLRSKNYIGVELVFFYMPDLFGMCWSVEAQNKNILYRNSLDNQVFF
jgi:hypothetical protein